MTSISFCRFCAARSPRFRRTTVPFVGEAFNAWRYAKLLPPDTFWGQPGYNLLIFALSGHGPQIMHKLSPNYSEVMRPFFPKLSS